MTPSTAPRAISVWKLLLGVSVLGILLGSGIYWVKALNDDALLEEVLKQQAGLPQVEDREVGMSKDITAPPEAALAGIPPYPHAVPHRVAERMSGQGEKMAVAWFSTDDSVDQVISYYEHAFSEQKKLFVSYRYNERTGYAGWLEPDHTSAYADAGLEMLDGVMHLVSVMREGRQTAVLLSATRPLALLEEGVKLPPGVVLPPWADPPQVFNLGEGAFTQMTVFSEVKGHGVDEVDHWMAEGLKQQGWQIADHASVPERTALDFKRQKEHLSLVLTPGAEKVGLMVQYSNQPTSLTEGL